MSACGAHCTSGAVALRSFFCTLHPRSSVSWQPALRSRTPSLLRWMLDLQAALLLRALQSQALQRLLDTWDGTQSSCFRLTSWGLFALRVCDLASLHALSSSLVLCSFGSSHTFVPFLFFLSPPRTLAFCLLIRCLSVPSCELWKGSALHGPCQRC